MHKRLILGIGLMMALPVSGYAEKTEADFKAAYAAAQAARKEAAALGYEWNTIGKLLKRSKKAAVKADYDTAVKLANEAKLHGELSVKQAHHEEKAWVDSVPRLPEK